MRELINKYAYVIIGVAIVGAMVLAVTRGCSNKPPTEVVKYMKAFYMDEETGEESVHSAAELPPLLGKSGKPTLVKAYKFTAGDGKDVIVYLEKYSDQAIEELKSSETDDMRKADLTMSGLLIRLPGEGNKWLAKNSPLGQKILTEAFGVLQRDGGKVEPVYPK